MNASPTLLAVRNRTRQLARSLTALQLYCHSHTYAQRLPELVTVLTAIARQIDELEVVSAGTLSQLLTHSVDWERSNRLDHEQFTFGLADLLESMAKALNVTSAQFSELNDKLAGGDS